MIFRVRQWDVYGHITLIPHQFSSGRIVIVVKMDPNQNLEMRGIEPRAFHMQSERSTTELHPLALTVEAT